MFNVIRSDPGVGGRPATGQASVPQRTAPLPKPYIAWVGGALISQLGDAALYFALGWAAASHGGAADGLVLSMVALPRTALLLVGGALGDRVGARRIMIAGDATMFVVSLVLAVMAWSLGTPLALLLVAALVIGTNDAFYLPAAGAMPRVLVEPEQVARAVALRQSGSQVITMVGGPIGGVLVALAGLPIAATADAITFLVVLLVLIRIRPRFTPDETRVRRHILREASEGVQLAMRTPGLRTVLLLIAGVAGFVLPVSSLLVPLLTRSHGWSASSAGLIIGAQAVGTVAVTLLVARLGTAVRAGLAASAGLVLTACGQFGLSASSRPLLAAGCALISGIGVGIFVSHLTPVLITAAPKTHLSRVQSLFSLVQSSALLITNNLIGNVAHEAGVRSGLLVCACVVFGCSVASLATPALRNLRSR